MKNVVILLLFVLLISGCSRVQWYRVFNQCQPCSNGGEYIDSSDSGLFRMGINHSLYIRMVGPPLIPIVPIPFLDNPQIIRLYATTESDSGFHMLDTNDFALRFRDSDKLLKPYKFSYYGKAPNFYYSYYFDIGDHPYDTLEVVFHKNYFGRKVPSVKFISATTSEYEAITFPSH